VLDLHIHKKEMTCFLEYSETGTHCW